MNPRSQILLSSRKRPRWLAAGLAVLLGLAVTLPASAQGPRLAGLQGGQLTEADLAQGATVIVVWASWSPRGKDIVDRVNAIQGRWGSRARVVTVNFQEDRGTVEGFLAGKRLAVPVYLDSDGAFSKKHAVTTLPGLLVVRDGNVAYRGRLPDDPTSILAETLG
jgi:thiol-disulfide isomerase/thioredoxin